MQTLPFLQSDRLPYRPYCTDDLSKGLKIRSQQHALERLYIQPNGPAHRWRMIYDVDREMAACSWMGETAEPNWVAINRDNGHAHIGFELAIPVVTSDAGLLKPLRYAAALEAAYTYKLGADWAYTGLICKNPLHKHWDVVEGPPLPYTLDQLSEYVPNISEWRKPSAINTTSLGRNCQMFDWLRHWAYRNINKTAWNSFDAWHRACLHQAEQKNTFAAPLPDPEIRATAKSVAKWVWKQLRGPQADYIARTHTSEIQSARGKKSGITRRKGTALEQNREPWVELGISRATWYRRQTKKY